MEKYVECGDMRFGAALNLHIHIHAVVSDGVFNTGADGSLCFTPVPFPTETELAAITGAGASIKDIYQPCNKALDN